VAIRRVWCTPGTPLEIVATAMIACCYVTSGWTWLTSVERISFDPTTQRLRVEIDLEDREYFTRPFDTAVAEYAPSNPTIEPFDCSPETHLGSVGD
jgi:hypothetical protein